MIGGGSGFGPSHLPNVSSLAAMSLAGSHSHWPVFWRREIRLRVPEANMGHSQRFQPFLRSSNRWF
jgi:hypothetical protein